MSKITKILFIEQPLRNRGDESAHRGIIKSILSKDSNVQITVIFCKKYTNKDIDEFRVNDKRVDYVNFIVPTIENIFSKRIFKIALIFNQKYFLHILPIIRKIKKYYDDADYIICAPGGISLGGFMDWMHAGLLFFAKSRKKKLAYWGRSIGPFDNDTFKKVSQQILSSCDFVSLRDIKSQNIATQLGIKYTPTLDSAFLADVSETLPEEVTLNLKSNYIVFVPNSLVWHYGFKQYPFNNIFKFWISFTNALIKEYPDHQVVMLPQTMGDYSAWEFPEGEKFFLQIKDACNLPQQVFVLNEKYGSDIQQSIIKNANFLIGARYHSIIFAINQDIPFISLSYEHKMSGVIKALDKQNCEVILNDVLSSNNQDEQIDNIIELTHNIKSDLAAKIKAKELTHSALNFFFNNLKY